MEVPRAQPKPPGDDPVALRWPFAKRHAAEQPPLVEPRGCLKDKKQWESGHTAYKPCLEEPLVLILGRAPRERNPRPLRAGRLPSGDRAYLQVRGARDNSGALTRCDER